MQDAWSTKSEKDWKNQLPSQPRKRLTRLPQAAQDFPTQRLSESLCRSLPLGIDQANELHVLTQFSQPAGHLPSHKSTKRVPREEVSWPSALFEDLVNSGINDQVEFGICID
jgi:hypothetical protein